ncbi:MAG: hypothetical protein FWF26_04760 [Treponema sp.]|nr:hypothetical protein [Treponema sp.]
MNNRINPLMETHRTIRQSRFVVHLFFCLSLLFLPAAIYAQDGFGFGDTDGSAGNSGLPPSSGFSVNIGGEAQAELKGFFSDMKSAKKLKDIQGGDIFSGNLNFDARGSDAEAVINLDLTPVFDGSSPVTFDEAYVRAFFGPVTVEGGLRKLSWGKADSFSPLDVVNPLDYTDLTKLSDPPSIKIARPMLHTTWSLGSFTKLEAVFVPWFQGDKFATTGRWTPKQVTDLRSLIDETLTTTTSEIESSPLPNKTELLGEINDIGVSLENSIESGSIYPQTDTLKYAQGGMRFTTSIGSSDFGFQYYFGRLSRPAITGLNPYGFFTPSAMPPLLTDLHAEALIPYINYNYYHQIAVDYASVVAGFNLRAEAGANITKDLDGKDGTVENPALVWSLGFDRDLFAGINFNLQGTGKVRLFYNEIGDDPLLDCEAGSDMSSTRITAKISRKFFRDELELRTIGLWGIEDRDFLVMPGVIWSRNDVSTELSAGFFGGDKNGELGQYRDDGFVRVILSYTF